MLTPKQGAVALSRDVWEVIQCRRASFKFSPSCVCIYNVILIFFLSLGASTWKGIHKRKDSLNLRNLIRR